MKVSELPVEELKDLIQTHTYIAMNEALLDFFGDPDEGLEFKEEFVQKLLASREAVQKGDAELIPAEEVTRRLRCQPRRNGEEAGR